MDIPSAMIISIFPLKYFCFIIESNASAMYLDSFLIGKINDIKIFNLQSHSKKCFIFPDLGLLILSTRLIINFNLGSRY